MNVDKFLEDLQKDIAMLENKGFEIEQWKSIAEYGGGTTEGERVQSSSSGDAMEKAAIEKVGVEETIKQIKKRIDSKIALLEELPASEYDLIHKIYVQDFTLKQFAYMKRRGSTWASEKHKDAKKHLQAIIGKKVTSRSESIHENNKG